MLEVKPTPAAEWLFRLFGRRWVRVSLVVVGLLVGTATVHYQVFVKPTLTATRFRVWVESRDDRVTVGVDEDAGIVSVSGGQKGLSEFVVTADSLFVLATDVAAKDDGAKWIEIPISDLETRLEVMVPSRILSALPRDTKTCKAPGSDTVRILTLVIDADELITAGVSLCGTAGDGASDGRDRLIVEVDAVQPSKLPSAPTSSVLALSDTTTPTAILEYVMRLIGGA